MNTSTRNGDINDLLHSQLQQGKGYDRRHFHQLFRQLRVAHRGAHRDVIKQDLGHFDNLLGNRQKRVEKAHDIRQLFHHLRHKCINNLHHGSTAHEVDNVLHGVPLDTLLRPRVRDRPRPHLPFGVLLVAQPGECLVCRRNALGSWCPSSLALAII